MAHLQRTLQLFGGLLLLAFWLQEKWYVHGLVNEWLYRRRGHPSFLHSTNMHDGNLDNGKLMMNNNDGKLRNGMRMTRPQSPVRSGSLKEATYELGRVPYGESSRKYRQTVYSHSDWVKHRSNERLFTNLRGIFYSGIIRQLKNEVGLVASLATFCVAWNDFLVPLSDHAFPCLVLPLFPFTLSSPALGLLLVFRTNASYRRWTEARMRWASIEAHSKNVVRMAATFSDMMDTKCFERVDLLSRTSLEASIALDEVCVDEKRRVEADKSLIILGDSLAACERFLKSPVPLIYTRHTARFLSLWLILLPFAIHQEFLRMGQTGFLTIPVAAVLSLFLFGVEELSVQLEVPFSILPLQKMCDTIKHDTADLVQWSVASRRRKGRHTALSSPPAELDTVYQDPNDFDEFA